MPEHSKIDEMLRRADAAAMAKLPARFAEVEQVRDENQLRLLKAFTDSRVAAHHLSGSTGYGYGDEGRDRLEEVFARYTGSEAALFRHQFMSGTHTISVMLFGLLRPGDVMLCASGRPYDTLAGVIGLPGAAGSGSLAEFGIGYRELPLQDGELDLPAICREAPGCRMLYLQRSRGYADRPPLSPEAIGRAAAAAKEANPGIIVAVDNCYGEFVRCEEPTMRGADVMAGSLIKNPGGGIAPTGGYIAGRAGLVAQCAERMSAPGVGAEVGSTAGVQRQLYLGLYFAPMVTAEALKAGLYASALFEELGFTVSPRWQAGRDDIITAVQTESAPRLAALCRGIQSMSPIDSFVTPEAWPMPGYDCDVIMAAGAFTLGSSIELSCDGPMKPPYTAYLQGSLNFAAGRAAIREGARRMLADN